MGEVDLQKHTPRTPYHSTFIVSMSVRDLVNKLFVRKQRTYVCLFLY